jgi:hypothetical protein
MTNPNGLKIVPGTAPVMGIELVTIADVDPEKFPNGLEVAISVPGSIAPLGHALIPRGFIICAIPPGPMVQHMRDAIRKAASQQRHVGPGEVKAPGL